MSLKLLVFAFFLTAVILDLPTVHGASVRVRRQDLGGASFPQGSTPPPGWIDTSYQAGDSLIAAQLGLTRAPVIYTLG